MTGDLPPYPFSVGELRPGVLPGRIQREEFPEMRVSFSHLMVFSRRIGEVICSHVPEGDRFPDRPLVSEHERRALLWDLRLRRSMDGIDCGACAGSSGRSLNNNAVRLHDKPAFP